MKMLKLIGWGSLVSCCMMAHFAAAQGQTQAKPAADHPHVKAAAPTQAVAVLVAKSESKVEGVVSFKQESGALLVSGEISGLKPGEHGFHIHEFGDLRDPAGESAGGHYDPRGHQHGGLESKERHAGDLGNIEANDNGVATFNIKVPGLKLASIVGRSIVVHGKADDLKSQPSGAAGPRVGIGVIGIAKAPAASR
jgi:Cu-Zn family superoxide dismutase